MSNIIFRPHYFGGKNNNFDEIFVPLSLKSVLKYNANSNVYFISNDPNFVLKNFRECPTNLHCYLFDDFIDDNIINITNSYVHLSHNQYGFEKFCILSYFYIYNLMEKLNINSLYVVETDVLIFDNLHSVFSKFYDLNNTDAILANENIMCSSYVTKIYLETFCNSAIKFYNDIVVLNCLKNMFTKMKSGGICDMTINDWIYKNPTFNALFTNLNSINKKIHITELTQILPNNSIFDNYLAKIDYNDENFESETKHISNNNTIKIKKIYSVDGMAYFKLNNNFIKCNSMHFQGSCKELMQDIYNEFINK